MTPSLLSVHDLSAGYGSVKVLSGIDLDVQEGEFVSVLGANGMGKTTLLRSVFGFCDVYAGDVLFEGRSLLKLRPSRRARAGISMLHEDRKIFSSQSVRENLQLAARSLSEQERRSEMEFVLSLFPVLEPRWGQTVRTMSGGEQQMVALAMCLMRRPRLLLLDEPTFGLAPRLVSELAKSFAPIRSRGLGIVLVEQNAEVALSSADKCVVIQNGKLVMSGSPATLRRDPRFAAAYFGLGDDMSQL